jgi:hypothetical protein
MKTLADGLSFKITPLMKLRINADKNTGLLYRSAF